MPELLEITSGKLQADGVVRKDWRKEKNAAIWCWLFLLVPFGILAASLAIASTPWFLRHNAYPWLQQTLGYSLRVRGLNCQILLYGDSTALVGLDPKLIEQRTGLKTCNISEMVPIHLMVGSDFPLDSYLEHNAPPTVILTMWGPLMPHPHPVPMTIYSPEGLQYALLYHRGAYLWKGLARNPEWVVEFSGFVIKGLIKDAAERLHLRAAHRSDLEEIPRDRRAGYWQYDLPPLAACDPTPHFEERLSEAEKRQSIEDFRNRYATGGVKVLFNIGPLAACVGGKEEIQRNSSGLYDNQFQILPTGDFVSENVHVTGEVAKVLSAQAADEILAAIHGSKPSAANRAAPDHGLPGSSR